MTHKVLFLTDSLGLPRPDKTILAHETWCQQVAKNLSSGNFEFFFQLHGGLHTKEIMLLRNQGYLGGYEPDTIVLQVGIVDCSSRVLGEKAKIIISRIPIINNLVRKFIKKFHRPLSVWRNFSYVNRDNFRKNIRDLQKSFPTQNFVVIPIAPPTGGFIEMMPRIEENVADYNQILIDEFKNEFLENLFSDEKPEHIILDDHYHLNKKGHSKVASEVISKISI